MITPLGDDALRFEIPPEANRAGLLAALRRLPPVRDVVLADRLGAVFFDGAPPAHAGRAVEMVLRLATGGHGGKPLEAIGDERPRAHVIRVRYDGEDLADAAAAADLPLSDFVQRHAEANYEVRMVGFLPGFAYLAPVGAAVPLVVPRRLVPRPRVPAGALAVGGPYTAVYPFASPGGWHLIGTAVGFEPFSLERGAALRVGDRVRFDPRG